MNRKFTITLLVLLLSFGASATTVLAAPTVDGDLSPDSEYSGGAVQTGTWSKCYSLYVSGDGLYICNDWYMPETNYDPDGTCDGYNVFYWTDTSTSPLMYYQLKCYGDGTKSLQKKPSGGSWEDIDCDDLLTDSDYVTTQNDTVNAHPVWEILIPDSKCGSSWTVGIKDPKKVDIANCPSGWYDTVGPDYGKIEVKRD